MDELDLFTEALSRSGPAERAAYLDQACGDNALLRERIDKLLALHASDASILNCQAEKLLEGLIGQRLNNHDAARTVAPEEMVEQLVTFLTASTHPGAIGRLGHYDVLEVLGQGGFGIVVKAFDNSLHRVVAIKILAPQLAATSPPRSRFLREARATARIQHENVVQIHAVEEQPFPYLVMEFIEGQTLQDRLNASGPLDPAEVVRIGRQIALGLAAAHDKGLIHRDVKPANILLEAGVEPRARLTDFGLARAGDDASMTQSGQIIGTPMYMSPEQVRGEELDHRADLFSLGSVLYTMCTGRPPFRASSTLVVMKRVAEDAPRPIRQVIPEIPLGLCAVINRLHEKSPARRFASAREAAAALDSCVSASTPRLRYFSGRKEWTAIAAGSLTLLALLALIARPWGLPPTTIGSVENPSPETGSSFAAATRQVMAADPAVSPPSASAYATEPQSPKGEVVSATIPDEDGMAAAEVPASTATTDSVPDVIELTDWEQTIGRLPAAEQVNSVTARLRELNPELPESVIHFEIKADAVDRVTIEPSDKLADITPLRALRQLTWLRVWGSEGRVTDLSPLEGLPLVHFEFVGHPVEDLSPLKGMPLTYVGLWQWAGDDLSPLRGMALTSGCFGACSLSDLEPLRGMPCTDLCFNFTGVEDLSPLVGMPLKKLAIEHTRVRDLTPIADVPLELLGTAGTPIKDFSVLRGKSLTWINLEYDEARDRSVLESLPLLKTVNNKPAAEFLGTAP